MDTARQEEEFVRSLLAPFERIEPATRAGRRSRQRRHGWRRSRGVVTLAAAAAVAAALFVAAPAFGVHPVGDLLGDEPTPSWTWPEGVPGESVPVPETVRLGNIEKQAFGRLGNNVDFGTLRQIVAAGKGKEREVQLAARGLDGDVCLAVVDGQFPRFQSVSPFGCLHRRAYIANQAVFVNESSGGHRGSVVDYATLTGVVRADVGRVEVQLADGETIELPLNRWRGFGYYTTDPERFPKTVSVYRTWSSFFRHHEKLVGQRALQEVRGLQPTPLCGGQYGPCPEGVTP
jgi:hypothetical protein